MGVRKVRRRWIPGLRDTGIWEWLDVVGGECLQLDFLPGQWGGLWWHSLMSWTEPRGEGNLFRFEFEVTGFLGDAVVENLPAMQETQVQSWGRKDPLEKGMATHYSFLAWRIPWTMGPGGLQFLGSQRVGHDWVSNTFAFGGDGGYCREGRSGEKSSLDVCT